MTELPVASFRIADTIAGDPTRRGHHYLRVAGVVPDGAQHLCRTQNETMRILLQQKTTGAYLQDVGSWTRDPAHAIDFLSSTRAIEFCSTHHITGVQLVLKFEEHHYDIVLPMSLDGAAARTNRMRT